MLITLTEVAFFAPFTVGLSVFGASSLSSSMTTYFEQLSKIQDDAFALKKETTEKKLSVEDIITELNVDKEKNKRYPSDVLDDLGTSSPFRDMYETEVPCFIGWKKFSIGSLSQHRNLNVRWSIYMAIIVTIAVVFEMLGWGDWKFFRDINIHLLSLGLLIALLFRTVLSISSCSQYLTKLSRSLVESHRCTNALRNKLDYMELTQNI